MEKEREKVRLKDLPTGPQLGAIFRVLSNLLSPAYANDVVSWFITLPDHHDCSHAFRHTVVAKSCTSWQRCIIPIIYRLSTCFNRCFIPLYPMIYRVSTILLVFILSFIAFEPSFWWCRISQPGCFSQVSKGGASHAAAQSRQCAGNVFRASWCSYKLHLVNIQKNIWKNMGNK